MPVNYSFARKVDGVFETVNFADKCAKLEIAVGSKEEKELFSDLYQRNSQLNVTADTLAEITPVAEAWGIPTTAIRTCEAVRKGKNGVEKKNTFYAFRVDKVAPREYTQEIHAGFAQACKASR